MGGSEHRQDRLWRIARALEICVVALAVAGFGFRATLYWHLPARPGARFGTGDLVDYALGLALFVVCAACATTGVISSARSGAQPRAFRPVLIGITTFVVYYFLQPLVPRVW